MRKKAAAVVLWIVLSFTLLAPGSLAGPPAELAGQVAFAAALAAVVTYAGMYSVPAKLRGWRAARADG